MLFFYEYLQFSPCEIILLTRKLSQFFSRKFSFFEKAWVYIVCDICVWVLIYKIIANIWSRNFATRGYLLKSVFSEIRVRIWVQVVSPPKNRPLIDRPDRSANQRTVFLVVNYLNSCRESHKKLLGNFHFWGARSGPPTHASAVRSRKQIRTY